MSRCNFVTPSIVMEGALGIRQGGTTHFAALWCCMWGRGQRGNNAACSAFHCLSVTSPATQKQIGPFWCSFLGGWFCVCSRTLWVSPVNSPLRLGVSPAASTPTDIFHSKVLRLSFPALEPWVAWSVSFPSCSPLFIHMQIWDCPLHQPSPCLVC